MTPSESAQHDDPPWLDADQLASWRSFMALMQRLPAALEVQLQQDSQLSFLEYYVLVLLSAEPTHRLRMSQLAAMVNCELSRLSHLISRFEKRGFVRRQPDPDDGRFTLAMVTDSGYAHLRSAAPNHVARVRELVVDVLTPRELQTLRRIADKVVKRIDTP